MTARVNQGDGASLWVLSEAGLQMKDLQQRLREASAAGFAPAQYSLAQLIFGGVEGAAGTGANKLNPVDLLNQAASAIPGSKTELAECEYLLGRCLHGSGDAKHYEHPERPQHRGSSSGAGGAVLARVRLANQGQSGM